MTTNAAPMSLDDLEQVFPTNCYWENLETMYNECSSMFGTLLPYPQQARELEPFANEEEKRELQRILRNIEADSKRYLATLRETHEQHCKEDGTIRTGQIYDSMKSDELFQYTALAVAYRNWMDEFQSLLMQPINDWTAITTIISNRNKENETTSV